MARVRNLEKRRADILEAALTVLFERGFCDLRIADVAKQAGVSAGLVCHHFDTKQGLLLAVMDHTVDVFEAQSQAVLDATETGQAKLLALVELALGPDQMNPRFSAAWLALYYLAASDPAYRAILQRYQRINLENIRAALQGAPSGEAVPDRAGLIAALVDGVWLQHAVRGTPYPADAVHRLAVDLLGLIPSSK